MAVETPAPAPPAQSCRNASSRVRCAAALGNQVAGKPETLEGREAQPNIYQMQSINVQAQHI